MGRRPGRRKRKHTPNLRARAVRKAPTASVFGIQGIAEAWNRRATTKDNLRAIGLVADPNRVAGAALGHRVFADDPMAAEDARAAAAAAASARAPCPIIVPDAAPPTPKFLGDNELACILQLYRAHGDDVDAMFRDGRRNFLQWTRMQLRSRLRRLLELHADVL